jgi:hypothetical protein
MSVPREQPIEICYIFTLGYRSRSVVDDLASARGEHDFHMDKGDG